MFGLFRRTRTRAGSQGRVSLGLEALERRDQPSSTPVIEGLMEQQISSGLFLVSGVVVDSNPGTVTVQFGSTQLASSQSTTARADGSFSEVLQLNGGATSGTVYVGAVDGQGAGAQTVSLTLSANSNTVPTPGAGLAPVIVDYAQEKLGNGQYLITGKVVDTNPGNLVVTFGGGTSASGTTVTTGADGSFSCKVQLRTDGSDYGYLSATATDGQNLTSQAVQVYLNPSSS
jgi:hypothetical protein